MIKQEIELDVLDYIVIARIMPLNVRGGWLELIIHSWNTDGIIIGTMDQLTRILCCERAEADMVIAFIKENKIFDYEDLENGKIKITCRNVKEKLALSEKRSKTGKRGADSKWSEKPELTLFENENGSATSTISQDSNGLPQIVPPAFQLQHKVNPTSVQEFEEIKTLFGFNEIAHPDKTRMIAEFISLIFHKDRYSHFKTQFKFYLKYKQESKEKKHSFKKFIDNGWDSENWEHKYNEFKNNIKSNGKPSKSQTTPIKSTNWDPSKPIVPI